jgi:hypothetical protein
MSERQEWIILGRVIGTATGWDQGDTFVIQIYDFEPAPGVNLPADECISFDFEKGLAQTYDDAGQTKESFDIISALQGARQSL